MKQKKLKKCKQCKSPFTPFNSMQKVCGTQCAQSFAVAEREKKEAKAKSDDVKRVRQRLKQLDKTSLPWQHKQTQKAFNKMRKLQEMLWFKEIGLEPECISCGKTKMDWCCGHFKTVGAHVWQKDRKQEVKPVSKVNIQNADTSSVAYKGKGTRPAHLTIKL